MKQLIYTGICLLIACISFAGKTNFLPVTVTAFTAQVEDNRLVQLQWQTASETNSSYFAVERTFNSTEFTEISRVNAQGLSNTLTYYKYTDANPVQFNKNIHYRLRVVDQDGHTWYSPLQGVILKGTTVVLKRVVPNPLPPGQPLSAEIITSAPQQLGIRLYSAAGVLVIQQQPAQVQAGYNRLQVNNTSRLVPGIYTLWIYGKEVSEKLQLVVQ